MKGCAVNEPIKVNMFILMQNDVNKAVDYYKAMGLPLKFHVLNKWAEFDINGVKLGLAQTDHELPERRTGIVLEVADLRAFYPQAKTAGIEFLSEPVEAVHGIIASFKDPGNNILDFYQPTPEKVREMMKKQQDSCCGSNDKESENCCKGEAKKENCCGSKKH